MAHRGRCDLCGCLTQVESVDFRKNTGLLVVRQTASWVGNACRACGRSVFTKFTLHNLVFGWWGMISFFVNFVFIANNVFQVLRVVRLPSERGATQNRLEEHRDYALNLLGSKEEAVVIEVLSKSAGASAEETAAFVRSLKP